MNRKTFLRLLGIGSIAAVVAPKLLIPKEDLSKKIINMRPGFTPLDAIINEIHRQDCELQLWQSKVLFASRRNSYFYAGDDLIKMLEEAQDGFLRNQI